MSESGGRRIRSILRINISRRQFIQKLISLGGAAIGGAALGASCTKPTDGTSPGSSEPFTAPVALANPSQVTLPGMTSSVNISTIVPSTMPLTAEATAAGAYVPYKAPATAPALIRIPETECTVATDRVYSLDHVWVKSIAPNLVVMGVTPSFVKLIYPFRLSLFGAGVNVPQNDTFGQIEGYKTTADLISPVAGKIMEANQYLIAQGKSDTIPLLDSGPFVGGWMVVMMITKPDELKELMSPQAYVERVLKMK